MTTITRLHNSPPEALATTGIKGLDDVRSGGLTLNRLYLPEGVPVSGKTTLAVHFQREGARRGVAESHGWSLEGITVRELVPSEDSLRPDDQYTRGTA